MRTIHIMVGVPASGKSTYCDKHGADDIVIHRDVVRQHLRELVKSNEYFPIDAGAEYEFYMGYIRAAYVGTEKDIWIDQTTLSAGAALKLLKGLQKFIDLNKVCLYFHIMDTPAAVCKERNAKRVGYSRVPDDVLDRMAYGFTFSVEELRRALPHTMKPVMKAVKHRGDEV